MCIIKGVNLKYLQFKVLRKARNIMRIVYTHKILNIINFKKIISVYKQLFVFILLLRSVVSMTELFRTFTGL